VAQRAAREAGSSPPATTPSETTPPVPTGGVEGSDAQNGGPSLKSPPRSTCRSRPWLRPTGGLDGVGGAVVLAGLPDDGVGIVLAAVVDGHSHAEGEGGFAVADGLAAVGVVLVGGDAEVGVEPIEGPLGLDLAHRVDVVVDPVTVVQLMGQVGVAVRPGLDLGMLGGQV
jgi:hypothetical protein